MNSHLPTQGHRHDPGHCHPSGPRTRGAALMMTLIMLVLLSILITGFVVSMRTELKVAYSNENIQRTKMVAQAAVSHGIDILRSNIPEPGRISADVGDTADAPPRNWISNPGRLIVNLGTSNEQIVDLHTGTQNAGDALTSFDLNQPLPGETTAAIVAVDSGPRPHMRVSWHNILQDPSRAAGTALDNGDINAVTGRYAFWMDDETSKLNFNVASGKNTDIWKWLADSWLVPITAIPRGFTTNAAATNENQGYALGNPVTINLDHLFGEEGVTGEFQFDRGRLRTHVYTNGWHQYPEAIMEYYDFDGDPEVIDPSEQEWYDKNKWNLTFYSRSPEFNVFGRSRFFTIYNPLAIEGGPVYQMPFASNDVLHLHTLMGGLEHNPNEAAVNAANLEVLLKYFERDDWPGYSGNSFADKWGGNNAFQVALNIIQMGVIASGDLTEGNNSPGSQHRFASNTAKDITDATRNDPTNTATPERDYWRDGNGNLFLPQSPGPYLTECHFDFFIEPDGTNPVVNVGNPPRERIRRYNIGFRYSTEYFMENWGWVVPTVPTRFNPIDSPSAQFSPFPTAIDFLRIKTFVLDKPDYVEGDIDAERENVKTNWVRQIRGTRNGLFHEDWNNLQHREVLIDIAPNLSPNGISPNIFTIGPASPERTGSPPGLGKIPNIKVAMSKKFYLPSSPGSGASSGYFVHGLIPEDDLYSSAANTPHPFSVQEVLNPQGQVTTVRGKAVEIRFDVRLGMTALNGNYNDNNVYPTAVFNRPKQMLPLGESPAVDAAPGAADGTRAGELVPGTNDVFSHTWKFDDIRVANGHNDVPATDFESFGWRITPGTEPRVALRQSDWSPTTAPIDSKVDFQYAKRQQSKFRHLQIGWSPNPNNGNTFGDMMRLRTGNLNNQRPQRGNRAFTENYRMTSPGYYSLVLTGMQTGDNYRTLSLLPKNEETYSAAGPPDYVLFDLFAPSFCLDGQQWTNAHRLPDSWSTVSYMNSTAGQINLNSRIYPDDAGEDFNPPARLKPLEAVFVHLRQNKNWATEFAAAIDSYQESQPFAYVGELAEVPGYITGAPSTDPFRKEEILRNMMPCLTTKSNTFGLWGVAQTVRKSPSNLDSNPERFEQGDQILGEKRFFALIERYVWQGRDGHPGNAHVDANGVWDKLAVPRLRTEGQISAGDYVNILHDIPGAPPNINPNQQFNGSGIAFAEMDGPEPVDMSQEARLALAEVPHSASTLEEAYNPPQPVLKYRVVYFKYLDQ